MLEFMDEGNDKAKKKSDSGTPVLDNFSKDLNKLAQEGKLDPVIGRKKEILRIAQILSRRKKNNPIIIGEPGAGKTAIVEGLAMMIHDGECPKNLMDKRIVSLDMNSLVAGTKYRGQFEERMKVIIEELQSSPNIILFIDEIHTIVGAGNSSGSLDASNIFKPALSRGEIQCIGATTLDEYRTNFEKDGALERRFQKVVVDPATKDETFEILKLSKEKYEDHHKVTYDDETLWTFVELADRYITDREFPDKAFDILDEVGARMQIDIKLPEVIENLKDEANKIKLEKINVILELLYQLLHVLYFRLSNGFYSMHKQEEELDKVTYGMFAPWILYKKDFQAIGGHDPLFAPFPYEDSDIFQRWILAGYELIQSRDAFVYHLTCRGHRWTEQVGQDDDYFKKVSERAARNYLRKWGTWVENNEYQYPIITPKYNIAYRIENCSNDLLKLLEPFCDRIYSDAEWMKYITLEQPNTMYDLTKRCHLLTNTDRYDYDDIIVEIDGSRFTQQDLSYLQMLPKIITESGEPGTFNLGNLTITIVTIKSYLDDLINLTTKK